MRAAVAKAVDIFSLVIAIYDTNIPSGAPRLALAGISVCVVVLCVVHSLFIGLVDETHCYCFAFFIIFLVPHLSPYSLTSLLPYSLASLPPYSLTHYPLSLFLHRSSLIWKLPRSPSHVRPCLLWLPIRFKTACCIIASHTLDGYGVFLMDQCTGQAKGKHCSNWIGWTGACSAVCWACQVF